ncbi:hypothetical protein V6N11_041593 [Hibiscus sabdariffa]|uniref:Uncharacterized protein n=1 Tax=Hibiscus sabdariffa TaxID=183260 RepID=A0ABR2RKZ7_9ROSI
MEQVKTEDKLCGESTQQPDLKALLQDDGASENVCFPATYMDYTIPTTSTKSLISNCSRFQTKKCTLLWETKVVVLVVSMAAPP